jgi:glycosyltransferase involved in cell wall biosynthesis
MGMEVHVQAMQGQRSTRRSLHSANMSGLGRATHRLLVGLQSQFFVTRIWAGVRRYDRVFVYRVPVPGWGRRLLAPYRDRLLFDFDDALDLPESEGGGVWQALRARWLREGLANAVAVSAVTVTSNRRNADVVRALGGNPVVVPTCVDLDRSRFRDRAHQLEERTVLGWTGTPSTARYLPLIEDALREVARLRPVSIRIIGAGRNPFTRLDAECRPWRADTEVAEIERIDVGLLPMRASWTPTNAEILGEAHGALLCRSQDEWVAALTRLVDDNSLRSTLGTRARRRVEAEYSVQVMGPSLCRLIASPTGAR